MASILGEPEAFIFKALNSVNDRNPQTKQQMTSRPAHPYARNLKTIIPKQNCHLIISTTIAQSAPGGDTPVHPSIIQTHQYKEPQAFSTEFFRFFKKVHYAVLPTILLQNGYFSAFTPSSWAALGKPGRSHLCIDVPWRVAHPVKKVLTSEVFAGNITICRILRTKKIHALNGGIRFSKP